jgi:hypothetical protein
MAIKAAATKQKDENDDEKNCGHVWLQSGETTLAGRGGSMEPEDH